MVGGWGRGCWGAFQFWERPSTDAFRRLHAPFVAAAARVCSKVGPSLWKCCSPDGCGRGVACQWHFTHVVAAPALRGSSPTWEQARRETGRNLLAVVAFCPLLFHLRAPASSATPTSSLQAGQSSAPKQLAMNVAESRCSYFVAIQTLAALATIIISTPPGGGAGAAALAHPTPPALPPLSVCLPACAADRHRHVCYHHCRLRCCRRPRHSVLPCGLLS